MRTVAGDTGCSPVCRAARVGLAGATSWAKVMVVANMSAVACAAALGEGPVLGGHPHPRPPPLAPPTSTGGVESAWLAGVC